MGTNSIQFGLPLLARELVEQAMRRRTYVIRVVYATLLFVMAYALFYDLLRNTTNVFSALGRGRSMFHTLLGLQFAGIYIFMPALGASAIAIEKERSTFALLLLTKLGPWAIVFEKLLSRMAPMLTFLLLGLPLLGFTYTLGGFGAVEFLTGAIGLGFALVQTAALALFCSAFCRTTTGALISAYLLQVLMMFGPPVVANMNDAGIRKMLMSIQCEDAPYLFFAPAMTGMWPSNGLGPTVLFVFSRGTQFVPVALTLSTVLLLVAARLVLVPRAFAVPGHRLQKLFRRLDAVFARWNNNRYTRGITLIAETSLLPETCPVAWIETTRTSLGSFRFLLRLLLVVEALLAMLVLFVANSTERSAGFVSMLVLLLWVGAVTLVAVKGASLIAGERSRQTLDVLLAAPLSTRTLLEQKLTGLRRLMLVLSVPLLSLFLFQAWWRCGPQTGNPWTDRQYIRPGLYLTAAISCTVIYLHVAAWLSVLIGLRSRNQTRAVLISLGSILALCIGPLLPVFIMAVMFRIREQEPFSFLFLLSPMALVMINEINSYHPAFTHPWAAVALNSIYYSVWWRVLRTWCLRDAPIWLGRTHEDLTDAESPPAVDQLCETDTSEGACAT
ncbi:MAG TPA: ABC transporter permease subunit [Planctomycetaceae bacterium]|nr:ABC transporter permease subunit [Planctomycetaceae bacterium]